MSGFSSKILSSALSGLNAQQAKIATASNNIANVNTPGYTRRRVETAVRDTGSIGSLSVGNGVSITGISRLSNAYIEDLMRKTSAESERFGVEEEFLSRLEPIFSLSEELPNIGTALNQFFAAADDLSLNPSSNELRANFIERSTDLVNVIKDTYSSIADLQLEADLRIATEVEEVNNLTSQIAELNQAIAVVERGGEVAADGRDLRDQLLSKLSEKIEFNIVEQSDGTATISLKNGFAIVFGSEARELNATTTPSFTASTADLLGGGAPTYVTFDYSGAGTAEVDLSSMIARGNGTLSGLLNTRGIYSPSMTSPFEVDGSLVEIASRVEAITRALLINVNATYIGPDRDAGTAGYQTSSVDLNGNTPSVYGLFTFGGASDADNNGPNSADLTASGNQNFSSILTLAVTTPSGVHAARDLSGGAPAALTYAVGDGSNMEALSALRSNVFTLTDGENFSESSTLDDGYNRLVSAMSGKINRARTGKSVAESQYEVALQRRDSESAVSIDEEMTSLIQFQQHYQAAARVISMASDMLNEIIGLI